MGEELEWDVAPALDRRPRSSNCRTAMPPEVEGCRSQAAVPAILCRPGSGVSCPAIPELWKSRKIAGIPFHYGEVVERVPGTDRYALKRVKEHDHAQELTPEAWWSLWTWATLMGTFGMPITAVITAGARYCRCVKRPTGACGEKTPQGCTGTALSNHGFGDAIDIVGVYWKDKRAVGSSLDVTLMHSWKDAEQGALLRRINGALRVAFATVFDYARSDHRDHFHCDTNRGRGPVNWWTSKGYSDPCEPLFVLGSLKRLGYLGSVQPATWPRARGALEDFARHTGVAVPSASDPKSWRSVVQRLGSCVALGEPVGCKKTS